MLVFGIQRSVFSERRFGYSFLNTEYRTRNTAHFLWPLLALCLILTACGDSKERIPADAPGYVDGKPVHPTIKIGRPYEVNGETYEPRYDPLYDETGMASWYGPGFHGKSTANGERFNQWAMTAAHKTLPMPSIVKVIHMQTGKEINVRVNDRGPFADGRIIDLSRGAAEELGIVGAGVAPVRVQYSKPDTEQYIAKLQLKKPDEWTQTDIALAKKEERDIEMAQSAPLDAIEMNSLEPAAHPPVEPATQVPELFAYNAPVKQETTVEARGVEMHETGYSEDAFSVLGASDSDPSTPVYTYDGKSPFARVASRVEEKPVITDGTMTVSPAAIEAAAGSRLFVQAGTFGSRDNAYTLADKIKSVAAVDVKELQSNGRTLYRVRLGPTANEATAQELVARLREYGIHDARMMKE